ncbi:MAG: hypothetical protein KatS3mg002_0257 [Candidatus Woesearchaeota archaeon]|nr:MAG: hypothetical protein KatS3mg002_0257 [Candidatus Woesearchaeota archaeon]
MAPPFSFIFLSKFFKNQGKMRVRTNDGSKHLNLRIPNG